MQDKSQVFLDRWQICIFGTLGTQVWHIFSCLQCQATGFVLEFFVNNGFKLPNFLHVKPARYLWQSAVTGQSVSMSTKNMFSRKLPLKADGRHLKIWGLKTIKSVHSIMMLMTQYDVKGQRVQNVDTHNMNSV